MYLRHEAITLFGGNAHAPANHLAELLGKIWDQCSGIRELLSRCQSRLNGLESTLYRHRPLPAQGAVHHDAEGVDVADGGGSCQVAAQLWGDAHHALT